MMKTILIDSFSHSVVTRLAKCPAEIGEGGNISMGPFNASCFWLVNEVVGRFLSWTDSSHFRCWRPIACKSPATFSHWELWLLLLQLVG